MCSFLLVCHLVAGAALASSGAVVADDGSSCLAHATLQTYLLDPAATQGSESEASGSTQSARQYPCMEEPPATGTPPSDTFSFLQVEQAVSAAATGWPANDHAEKAPRQPRRTGLDKTALLAKAHREVVRARRDVTERTTLLAACLVVTIVAAIYFCAKAALAEEKVEAITEAPSAEALLEQRPPGFRPVPRQPSSLGLTSGLSQLPSAGTSFTSIGEDWVPYVPVVKIKREVSWSSGDESCPLRDEMELFAPNALDKAGVTVEFSSVSLAVGGCQILKSVDGTVEAGRTTAILGDSSCGSSELLRLLAGRLRTDIDGIAYVGHLSVSGRPLPQPEALQHRIGLVPQEVCLSRFDTVGEYLAFTAHLRFPRTAAPERRAEAVDDAMKRVGLDGRRSLLIGTGCATTAGLSKATQRRVAISAELLNQPEMLFLEEPFSTMGSFDARWFAATLRQLTMSQGMGVACSVHAPSSETFRMFDDAIIMHKGEIIYTGPADQLIDHLSNIGHPCPIASNPADHVMFLLEQSDKYDHKIAVGMKDEWLGCRTRRQMLETINVRRGPSSSLASGLPGLPAPQPTLLQEMGVAAPGFWTQLWVLLQREFRHMLRNTSLHKLRIGLAITLSVLVSFVFRGLASDSDDPLFDDGGNCRPDQYDSYNCATLFQLHLRCLVALIMMAWVAGLTPVLVNLPEGKKVFIQEYSSGMYGVLPYIIAKCWVELPSLLAVVIIFIWIDRFPLGLHGPFWTMVLLAWLSLATATSLAIGMGMALATPQRAIPIVPVALLMVALVSGVFMEVDMFLPWFGWVEYCMPIKYVLNCVGSVEFQFLEDAIEHCESNSQQLTDSARRDECQASYPGDYLRRDLLEAQHIYSGWYSYDLYMACGWVVIAVLAATAMVKLGNGQGKPQLNATAVASASSSRPVASTSFSGNGAGNSDARQPQPPASAAAAGAASAAAGSQ